MLRCGKILSVDGKIVANMLPTCCRIVGVVRWWRSQHVGNMLATMFAKVAFGTKCPIGHNGRAILAKSSIGHISGSKRARTAKLGALVDLVGGYCTLVHYSAPPLRLAARRRKMVIF